MYSFSWYRWASRVLLLLFAVKLILSILIVSFLLSPTTIYRNRLTEIVHCSFDTINVDARHLFCDFPFIHDDSFKSNEIAKVLDLPNGTILSNELQNFGICLMNRKTMNENIDQCYCTLGASFVYVWLISNTSFFLLLEIVQVLGILVVWYKPDKFMMVWKFAMSLQFVGFVAWLVVLYFAITYHTMWSDVVALPNALYSESYFKRPLKWSFAVGLSVVTWFCFVLECFYLWKLRPRIVHAPPPSQVVEEEVPEIFQDANPIDEERDTWSAESFSERVKDRVLNWRQAQKLTSKSWP